MKKWFLLLSLVILVTGCSLQDVNNSIDYVGQATEYIDKMQQFSNEAPALAEQAANDPQAVGDLKTRLQDIQQEMEAFNQLEPPGIASDIHQQIETQNEKLDSAITTTLDNIEKGQVTAESLQNSELMQTVGNITDLMEQVQNLGQ